MEEEKGFVVFCGPDCSHTADQACALDAKRALIEQRSVPHDGDSLKGLAEWVIELAGGQAGRVAVGIEVCRTGQWWKQGWKAA